MNSRDKGARGERMWRDEIKRNGFYAIRGCQNSGGQDTPDVICNIPVHFEVKFVEKLNISKAMEQAVRDNGDSDKFPAVAHKRSREDWLVTISAYDFFRILRQEVDIDITEETTTPPQKGGGI